MPTCFDARVFGLQKKEAQACIVVFDKNTERKIQKIDMTKIKR
jgi:hypothetical protein